MCAKWMTPFQKQCFIVMGASINMSQIGMVLGFAAVLLTQLRADNSDIPIDESTGSWIASLPGFAFLVGNVTIPILMAKLGRKKASLISIMIVIAGWACIAAAQNIYWLLTARFLQGISVGMGSCLMPVMIGEYTSPKNRGAFSILMSVIMAAGTLTVHTLGSYVTWRATALTVISISFVNLLMVAVSSESPSWLAEKGKYEECEKVFRWLRGDEIDELNKLIQINKASRQSAIDKCSMSSKIKEYCAIVKKKEFYKPIIIMIHLFTMGQWGGINILAPYIVDMVQNTMGKEVNMAFFIMSVDMQRVLSSVVAVFIIRSVRRRTMLFVSCGINALIFFLTAVYLYVKHTYALSFDHPAIGGVLIHALMMTVAIGSLPLPYTIASEIFSLKYRSVSGGISSSICSVNIFLSIKTFPYLVRTVGLYGAYCLYSCIMIYCLFVVWCFLPETKDRTLQEIEDTFKGTMELEEDLIAAEPLKSLKVNNEKD